MQPSPAPRIMEDDLRELRAMVDRQAELRSLWASGPDRTYWRAEALWRLREWRRLYRQPERAAFQQAVARSRA